MNLKELYQELIIEHGTAPRNCCVLAHATNKAEGFNPLCGDKVQVYLVVENNHIVKASFEGKGCAISVASASLMTEILPGKTSDEALSLCKDFSALLTAESSEISEKRLPQTLGKLMALEGVKSFPARVKCATLAWHTLKAAIQSQNTPITTETAETLDSIEVIV